MKTTDEEQLNEISERVIGCAFKVSNKLGCGFFEKVYENALLIELRKAGLRALAQVPVKVLYDGEVVGEFFADIVVEDAIILELKATKEGHEAHVAQCLNYLKATGIPLCLLINFGKPRVEVKRLRGQ